MVIPKMKKRISLSARNTVLHYDDNDYDGTVMKYLCSDKMILEMMKRDASLPGKLHCDDGEYDDDDSNEPVAVIR